jgi:hypothetical protein
MGQATYRHLLPMTLEWTGEFGSELVLFAPFCRWLSTNGLLEDKTICTYKGMRCFYEDMNCKGVLEKTERRYFVPPAKRPFWLPVNDEHTFGNNGRSAFLLFDDMRRRFSGRELRVLQLAGGKPILIIHNKYNEEWKGEPVNFISLTCLDRLFEILKHKFMVIYIRHSADEITWGFSPDANTMKEFNDHKILLDHPEVREFRSLYLMEKAIYSDLDLNTFKNMLYSRSYYFITTQGGGAHHIAMFSDSKVLVLHRRGKEVHWAYSEGYYKFMAPTPPALVVCHSEDRLLEEAVFLASAFDSHGNRRPNSGTEAARRVAAQGRLDR